MNTDQMDKKIIFQDENSYSVEDKSCMSCKYYFKACFPTSEPCRACYEFSGWKSHIEEVKFTTQTVYDPVKDEELVEIKRCVNDKAETGHDIFKPIFSGTGAKLPDSGDRREFSTGSVRDVRSGKGRYDLLSPIALKAYAKRMEDGMSKYGERNWEKGQPVMSYIDSAMRHMWNFIDDCMCGRVAEEDHLGAAMWNVASCIHTVEMIKNGSLPNSLDDTPKPDVPPTADPCKDCCHDFETRGEDANENKNNV